MVSERLREYGAVPEEVPTIAVEPPRTPQQMERAVKGLVTGRYQWVAFTSTNAVKAVREKLEEYGLDARAFAGVKVAAVGEQTSAALLDFGIRPDLVPDGQQSAEGPGRRLAAVRRPARPDQPGAAAAGGHRDGDAARQADRAGLGGGGRDRVPDGARRAAARPDPGGDQGRRVRRGAVHLVVHRRNLVGIAGKPHAVTVIGVIGPQTAKTAAEFGLRVDVTAPKPSVTALVDALAEFGAAQRDAAVDGGRAAAPPERAPPRRPPQAPLALRHAPAMNVPRSWL